MNETITSDNLANFAPMPADPELEEMAKAGVHLGHAKSKNHPAMQPYIFGVRNTVSVIDLTKTKEKLAAAESFLRGIASRGGLVLLVGTRPSARKIIHEIAGKTHMPYFTERWIGGTLTNFKMIARRVEHMETMEREKAVGGFEKYKKAERLKKEEEIERLKKTFDGIRTLKRLPDAVFIVDITEDTTAVDEARKTKIPVVALVDTNSNAKLADWLIPANDDALPAVTYMVGRIGAALEEGQREGAIKKETTPPAA